MSSDGQLVLREDRRETRNLAVLKLGGTAKVQTLLELPNRENNADLSPDGRWLAYQSSEGGGTGDEIFVRPFPDVNGGRWQVSNGLSAKPRWSRDGRQLFFQSYKTNTLSSVSVIAGSTFSAGPATLVINDVNRYFNVVPGRPWDISPDGERFLMIKEASGPQPTAAKLVLVTNWVEELRPQ